MRLLSETKQLITFIKAMRTEQYGSMAVNDACWYLKLNETMVGKTLSKMKHAGVITRTPGRGNGTRYIIPDQLKLGDLIKLIQGLNFEDDTITNQVIETLNQTTI